MGLQIWRKKAWSLPLGHDQEIGTRTVVCVCVFGGVGGAGASEGGWGSLLVGVEEQSRDARMALGLHLEK